MQYVSEFHRVAVTFAQANWPIFPCKPDSKVPLTAHGFRDATTDIDQIAEWWQKTPMANPAFCPNDVGLAVVDVEAEGKEAWHALVREFVIPETYRVNTPRGGWHFYFSGVLPQSAWSPGSRRSLGHKIDTRGIGSYVLCPGSVVGGRSYVTAHDVAFADVPTWMAEKLRPH